jgi:hypothetical protein
MRQATDLTEEIEVLHVRHGLMEALLLIAHAFSSNLDFNRHQFNERRTWMETRRLLWWTRAEYTDLAKIPLKHRTISSISRGTVSGGHIHHKLTVDDAFIHSMK